MNKLNKIIYGVLGALLYIGVMVGFGFILNIFWEMPKECAIIYWVLKGVICAAVLIYVLITVLGAKDKGIGTMQIFFTLMFSFLPLICRAVYFIPVAGRVLSIILAFIGGAIYFITMLGLGYYGTDVNNNSDNPKNEI